MSIILNIETAKHYAYEHNALKIIHFFIQLYKYEKPAFDLSLCYYLYCLEWVLAYLQHMFMPPYNEIVLQFASVNFKRLYYLYVHTR